MTMDCEVIRDLLPLYADDACSKASRDVVEEHLQGCPECREVLHRIRESEIEEELMNEKNEVIEYGQKRFNRRSAMVGSVIAGLFMIPILVCLIVNIINGMALGSFFIVLASLLVAASLIIVPVMMPEDKAFWTFCAFTASLILLFSIVCIFTGGNWFWIASSALLFGLSVVFLPFLIRARPLKKVLGNSNRVLVVLGVDVVLFMNMMNMIRSAGRVKLGTIFFTLVLGVGIGFVGSEILRAKA